jgi:hypothetical protein
MKVIDKRRMRRGLAIVQLAGAIFSLAAIADARTIMAAGSVPGPAARARA